MDSFATRIPASASRSRHYDALDALRGVAALLVVILHEHENLAGLPRPYSGYLAVDLFFLLSGFVIASAYDKRLADGMSVLAFLKVRLIRLYPLYLMGFAIGLVRMLIQFKIGSTPPPTGPFALGSLLELFLIPTPMTIDWSFDTLFYLNPPAWSLFYEIGINLLFAWLHPHLTRRTLNVLIVIMGALLIWVAFHAGSLEVGNFWRSLLLSVPRVAFPFLVGVWLHRASLRLPALGNGSTWCTMLAVVLVLSLNPGQQWRAAYDLAMVILVFPTLLLVSSAAVLSGITQRIASITGEMSYAVYIVHMPTFGVILAVIRHAAPDLKSNTLSGPILVILVAIACLAADRFYDRPVRRWLTNYLKPSQRQVQATA